MFIKYLKNSIVEYLLCIGIGVSISINVFQGFYVPKDKSSNIVLLTILSSILLLAMFLSAYSKRTIIISIITSVVISISLIVYFNLNSMNNYSFYIITFICCLITFLLSRNKIGTIALFLSGIIAFGFMALLQYKQFVLGFIIFLLAVTTMYFFKTYRRNTVIYRTTKISFCGFPLIILALCTMSLGISLLAFNFIIKPLSPPTLNSKFISVAKSLDIAHKLGVESTIHLYNKEKTTSKTNNNQVTSSNNNQQTQDNKTESPDKNNNQNNSQTPQNTPDNTIENNKDAKDKSEAVTYEERNFLAIKIIATIILSIIAIILTKKLSRKFWYNKILKQDRRSQVISFYSFYLRKLKLLGIRKNSTDTPYEFAKRTSTTLKGFKTGDVDINSLTKIFVKATYGYDDITDEEYHKFIKFHQNFFKNCRRKMGLMKYGTKFILL